MQEGAEKQHGTVPASRGNTADSFDLARTSGTLSVARLPREGPVALRPRITLPPTFYGGAGSRAIFVMGGTGLPLSRMSTGQFRPDPLRCLKLT